MNHDSRMHACIRRTHGVYCLAARPCPLLYCTAGSLYLDEQVVSGWLAPLPRVLWDMGAAAPLTSAAALRLMLDAARFAPTGAGLCLCLCPACVASRLLPAPAYPSPPHPVSARISRTIPMHLPTQLPSYTKLPSYLQATCIPMCYVQA